jgi:hypothetical protein
MTTEIDEMIDKAWKFVEIHRCAKAFEGWSEKEFKDYVLDKILHKGFLMCSDLEGRVIGIVTGTSDDIHKLFHVSNILTIHPIAIKTFVQHFDILYPGYSLAGYRRKILKQYDTIRFKRKILNAKRF